MHESHPQRRTIGELADTNPEALGVGADPRAHFKYVDLSSVSGGTVAWNSAPEVTLFTAPGRARRVLRCGDVLFGTVRPSLQSHGYVDWTGDLALIGSTGFSVLRAKAGVSDPRYLFHCIMSSAVTAQANRHAVGSSYPALSDSDVRRFEVFAPPLDDQLAVAQILDTLDTTIRQTEAVIEKLQQVKQGLLHDLLTRGIDANGELRPPQSQAPHLYKDSRLGWIPSAWNAIPFSRLADFVNGNSFDASRWSERGLPIIRIQNLNGSMDFNYYEGPVNPKWHVLPGDLLFAWSGQRGVSFGPRIWSGPEGVLNQHIFKVVERSPIVTKRYLYEVLRFRQGVIEDSAHGFKDSFLHVTRGELSGVMASIPEPDEQDAIVDRIEALERRLNGERLIHEKHRALKAGLMDDLLTGRVRVTSLLT